MKRIASYAAGAVLATASLLGGSTAAQAAIIASETARAAECGNGYICLFEHDAFKGYKVQMMVRQGYCRNLGPSMNNEASSMINEANYRVLFYDGVNCTGTQGYTAAANSFDVNLTPNHWDNRVTSLRGSWES